MKGGESIKTDIIKTTINVKDTTIGVMRVKDIDYISLTDLARYQNSSEPSFTVKNWLRRISTLDYVGLWKKLVCYVTNTMGKKNKCYRNNV